jgi:hypothetical protein
LFTHADAGISSYPTARTERMSNLRLADSATGYAGAYSPSTPAFDYTFAGNPLDGVSPLTVAYTVQRVAGTGASNLHTMTVPIDYGDGSGENKTVTDQAVASFSHTYTVTQQTTFTPSVAPVLST